MNMVPNQKQCVCASVDLYPWCREQHQKRDGCYTSVPVYMFEIYEYTFNRVQNLKITSSYSNIIAKTFFIDFHITISRQPNLIVFGQTSDSPATNMLAIGHNDFSKQQRVAGI